MATDTRRCAVMGPSLTLALLSLLALVAYLHPAVALTERMGSNQEDADALLKEELLLPVSRPINKSRPRPTARPSLQDGSALRFQELQQHPPSTLAPTTPKSLPQLTTHNTEDMELADLLLDDDVFVAEGDKVLRIRRRVPEVSGDNPDERSVIASLKVDLTFNAALADPSSTEYKNFDLEVETALNTIYQSSVPGYESVEVTAFRQGSVIIDHNVTFLSITVLNRTSVADCLHSLQQTGTITINNTAYTILDDPTVDDGTSGLPAICYLCGNQTCVQSPATGTYTCRLTDLYSYGEATTGETRLVQGDDVSSPAIALPAGMPVGDTNVNKAYVTTNGLVSFDQTFRSLSPTLLPVVNRLLVCPFWADLTTQDISSPNTFISYKLYQRGQPSVTEILARANEDVVTYAGRSSYDAAYVLVATWSEVPPYMGRLTEISTFQTAIITDGQTSYARIQFKRGEMKFDRNKRRKFSVGVSSGDLSATFLHNQYDKAVDAVLGNTGVEGLWLSKLGEQSNSAMRCYEWYWRNLPNLSTLTSKATSLSRCPCSSSQMQFERRWRLFTTEGNIKCYRFNNRQKYTKTCCYENSALITSPPNAGSLLEYNPRTDDARYQQENVEPKRYCCKESALCSLYYTVRPLEQRCRRRSSLRFAKGLGDPHIGLLDGGTYAFNGWGEYNMMILNSTSETAKVNVQMRTCLTETGNTTVNATVFCALAGKDQSGASFHVELNTEKDGLAVYVNGEDVTRRFYEQGNFSHVQDENEPAISVSRKNSSVEIVFESGVTLSVEPGVRQLVVSMGVPDDYNGMTSGLVGNFNGVPGDDYIFPNGSAQTDTSERGLFAFGETWRIRSQQDSHFFYYPGYSMASFQHPEFVPLFLDEVDNTTRNEALNVCGDNPSCIFDYVATKDTSFALATNSTLTQLEEQDSLNANSAPQINGVDRLEVMLNETKNITVTATDNETSSLFYRVLEKPSQSFEFDENNGQISWIPATTNSEAIRITAIDPQGAESDIFDPVIVLCDGCKGHGSCNYSNPRTPDSSRPNFQLAACVCNVGYSGDSCETDTDGCADEPCLAGQNCTDLTPDEEDVTKETHRCSTSCPTGYQLNSTVGKCQDIDECQESGVCDQQCTNFVGSYQCSCNPGFRRNGVCADIDECNENLSDCDQICTNTVGNYTCSCYSGFTLQSDGRSCVKDQVDPCAGQQNSCTFACVVDGGTAKCVCPVGYQLAADSSTCEDVNECTLNLCSQTCTNNNGSYTCSCLPGFQLDSDRQTCTTCPEGRYGANCAQECQCRGRATSCNSVTGCVCQSGYTGVNCVDDVNECTANVTICGNKTCSNNVGSHTCLCPSGYTLAADGSCQDIDECKGSHDCQQTCTNTPGSYVCGCNIGFTTANATHCQDVDECAAQTSNCEQQCHNLVGSYNCLCEFGFILNSDRQTCGQVSNPCLALSSLDCEYGCRVNSTANSTYCFCKQGYKLNDDNTTCSDIDECASNSTNFCSQTCTNTNGTYVCSCSTGYSLANDKRSCEPCDSSHYGDNCTQLCECNPQGSQRCNPVSGCECKAGVKGEKCDIDQDECATNNGGCGSNLVCTNTFGSFVCTCKSGYTLAPNMSYCLDVDECSAIPAPCDQICTNTPGSYSCSCNSGFTQADGRTCTDIDECQTNKGGCDTKCRNSQGGFVCECNDGYTLHATNRSVCVDVDECSAIPAPCDQICTNTPGNYSCSCNSGFTLQADGRACTDIDECVVGNGNCSSTCNNTQGSFFCECPTNFILGSDNKTCSATQVTRAFTLTLDTNVDQSVLSNPSSAEYKALVQLLTTGLETYLAQHLTGVYSVQITSLTSGSLVVDALISMVRGINDPNSELAKGLEALVQQSYLTFNGSNTPLSVITYNNTNITVDSTPCDVLAILEPCPSSQRCEESNGLPKCQDIPASTDLTLILGLGIGIPLFFILVGIIILVVVLCLRRRRQHRHRSLHAHEPSEADRYGRSIFAAGMPTKGSYGARQYGLYNPDTLSEAASQASGSSGGGGGRRLGGRSGYPPRRLYDDDQPWYDNRPGGARRDAGWEPEQPASNFSWDHMFRMLEPLGNLKIQRPNVTPTPRPAYTSSETPRRPFYSDA